MTSTQTKSHLPSTGLRLDVYNGRHNASNYGVTEQFDTLLLVDEFDFEGHDKLPEVNRAQAVYLVVRSFYDGKIVHLQPLNDPRDNGLNIGPMFGGSYAGTSDSRFRREVERLLGHSFYGAVAVHDRFETAEQYRALSI